MVLLLFITATTAGAEQSDLEAARAVFDANIAAIRARDRDKYLSLYLHDPALVRTGPAGFDTGFEEFEKGVGTRWPDTIDAFDIRLTPIRPGVVYGTYRYRVRYGNEEIIGVSERLFMKTPEGWRIALTGAINTPPGTPPPARALVGGTVIDGRGGPPLRDAVVVLRDGKIECAGKCEVPPRTDVLDARGMWITPGLVDAHVHFSQTGWADGRPDALDVRATHPYEKVQAELKANPERFGRSYVCSGVTTVFDVGGFPWSLQISERFRGNTTVPRVVSAGPLLSTLDHWLNLPAERQFVHLKDEASGRAASQYLVSQGAKAIKVWYIVRPDLPFEGAIEAIRAAGEEARKANVPLIVHANGPAEAKEALRAGARLLVHNIWDGPVDQEILDLAIRNGTIVTPTMTVARGYVRMFQGVVDRKPPVIDDPNGCVDAATRARVAETASLPATMVKAEDVARRDQRTKEREAMAVANLKKLLAAGIPIATGTDAGNPLTLHGPAIYAEMESMQRAGMTPMQVIVASTATAARAAGVEKETGTIEVGKDADLVILGADPSADVANFRKIRYVVRAGVVRSIEDLSALAK